MALVAVAMDFGDGLRVTDTGGGCISFAETLIGTDNQFRGPDFSMGFRFRLINTSLSGTARIGMTDNLGEARRQYINVTASGSLIGITAVLDTTACGFQIQHVWDIAEDTDEHSVWWTYDADGQSRLYVDGVEVDVFSALCSDISEPADTSDSFSIWGSTTPGIEVFYVDEAGYSDGILAAGVIADFHANGLP